MNAKAHPISNSRDSLFDSVLGRRQSEAAAESDAENLACSAFSYLRGMHERSLSLEFRFRNGNREWFSYALLASCRFDPSAGLLLKFTADVVTLVLIRGSNLNLPVHDGAVDLIERGLERHRVMWIREMDDLELRKVGDKEPTIDRIEVAECETQEQVHDWLAKAAPSFLRR